MPTHHGLWPDRDEVATPVPAEPTGQDPDELVADAQWRPFPAGAGEDRQLVTQEQVLGDEIGAATQRGAQRTEQQDEEFDHGRRMHDPEAVQPFAVSQVRLVACAVHRRPLRSW